MKIAKRIALGSFKSSAADLRSNTELMLKLAGQAKEQGFSILLFPELSLCGTDCQDLLFNDAFALKCASAVLSFAKAVPEDLTVGFGCALRDACGKLFDAYIFVKDGGIEAVYTAKGFTPAFTDYRRRYFAESDGREQTFFVVDSNIVHEERNGFDLGGIKTAVVFDPAFDKKFKKADLVVLPTARTYEAGGIQSAVDNILKLSEKCRGLIAAPNLCGNESGGAILDGVCLMARKGKLLVRSPELYFADTKLVTAQSGIAENTHPYNEMLRAVALGLQDFMLRSGSSGYALSLSGGADSALCAAEATIAQLLMLDELGPEEYCAKLVKAGIELPVCSGDIFEYVKTVVMPRMLTTVYQASDNSGDVTRTAAREVANALGASHHEISVSKLVNDYVEVYNSICAGNPLSWEHDDITLQNIQARSRLPMIWMVANRERKLLIATSNLSEAVVGYCTMDGDTAGGVSPIAGIGKSVVRRINKHLETEGLPFGDGKVFKLPAMSYITAQEPTAELRPGGQQTDERDLMPYVVLDFIRSHFADLHMGPVEILEALKQCEQFKDIEPVKLAEHVKRYFLLHARSQWKRERFAVGFHIERDDSSPKGFWRFPIFSGDLKVLTEDLN